MKCWFYCYGPFEERRATSTCVVVEGGVWGGTTTAPIAQEIMSRLFAMDKGASENVAFLQPREGNFNGATDGSIRIPGRDRARSRRHADPDAPTPPMPVGRRRRHLGGDAPRRHDSARSARASAFI